MLLEFKLGLVRLISELDIDKECDAPAQQLADILCTFVYGRICTAREERAIDAGG